MFTIGDNPGGPFRDPVAVARVTSALSLLAQAQAYAADAGASAWEFAVEIDSLEKSGLTTTDLRWLLAKGFLQHGTDNSGPGGLCRQVEAVSAARAFGFTEQSCFILSATGWELLDPHARLKPLERAPVESSLRPRWDDERQELRVGELLVKKFKLPAPNQRRVLVAFEEEEWPYRVDDPLPQHPEIEPKRQLHHTLMALNRNQQHRVIRFLGDGSGVGICWVLIKNGAATG